MNSEWATVLDWSRMNGLIPAIVQDSDSGEILMLGYMSEPALAETLRTGLVTFHSRSRGRLWQKGETSGNCLRLRAIRPDCDGDALLVQAEPAGPTCHRGTASCFGEGTAPGIAGIGRLDRTVRERVGAAPTESYTARLIAGGPTRIAQKVGEEGVEVALAAAVGSDEELVGEIADLVYHLQVLMAARGIGWNQVSDRLDQRRRGDGVDP